MKAKKEYNLVLVAIRWRLSQIIFSVQTFEITKFGWVSHKLHFESHKSLVMGPMIINAKSLNDLDCQSCFYPRLRPEITIRLSNDRHLIVKEE